MIEEKYQLVTKKPRTTSPRWRTVAGRMGWIGALAIVLVVGALYGRLVMEQALMTEDGVTASPATIGTAANTAAPALQEVASLTADQEALANLYSQVSPSVVNIQVTSRIALFPGFGLPREDDEAPLEQALGSGFIY